MTILNNEVVIIGAAQTHKDIDYSICRDYWSQNAMHRAVDADKFDMVFQIHKPGSGEGHIDEEDHREWLKTWDRPIVVQSLDIAKELEIKKPIVYPLKKIVEAYCPDGKPYFTNTMDYMICLALLKDYKKISLYGITMLSEQDNEYFKMRQSFEYYIGLARGLKIEVFIPNSSALCKTQWQYGWETEPSNDMLTILAVNQTELNTKLQELKQKKTDLESQIHMLSGGLQVVNQLIDLSKRNARGMPLVSD